MEEGVLVLFQGDSITECGRRKEFDEVLFNTGLGEGYVQIIASELLRSKPRDDMRFLNRGISGNRIVDLYARWKIDALNLEPRAVSLLVGVNDVMHERFYRNGVEIDRFNSFYRMLIDWTLEALPDVKLILMEPFILSFSLIIPECEDKVVERGECVRSISRDYNTVFVPLQQLFSDRRDDPEVKFWLSDGIHPTLAGHRLIADQWLKVVGETDILEPKRVPQPPKLHLRTFS